MRRLEGNLKKNKERLITATRNNTNNTRIKKNKKKLENKNGKESNCMDISSGK